MTPTPLFGEIRLPVPASGEARRLHEALEALSLEDFELDSCTSEDGHVVARFQAHCGIPKGKMLIMSLCQVLHEALDPQTPYGALTLFNPEEPDGILMELRTGRSSHISLRDRDNTCHGIASDKGIELVRNRGLFRVFTYAINDEIFDDVRGINSLFSTPQMKPDGPPAELANAAVYSENPEIFNWLCENGWPQLRASPEELGCNLLATAASISLEMTEFMLTQRQWDTQSDDLAHELSSAARDGSAATLQVLVAAGFDPCATDEDGYSIVKWAVAGVDHPQRGAVLEWLFTHYPETFKADVMDPRLLDPEATQYPWVGPFIEKLALTQNTLAANTVVRPRRAL